MTYSQVAGGCAVLSQGSQVVVDTWAQGRTLTRVTSSRGFSLHAVRIDRAGEVLPLKNIFRALPASLAKPERRNTERPLRGKEPLAPAPLRAYCIQRSAVC